MSSFDPAALLATQHLHRHSRCYRPAASEAGLLFGLLLLLARGLPAFKAVAGLRIVSLS